MPASIASKLHVPLFTLQIPQKALAAFNITPTAWFELMAAMAEIELDYDNLANTFITLEDFCKIVGYAKMVFGEERFLRIYLEDITPAQLGPAGMVLATAPTIGEGLEHWIRSGKFILPMLVIEGHLDGSYFYTTNEYTVDIGPLSTTILELLVLLTVRLIQQISDGKVWVGARFRHKQYLPTQFYKDHLGFVPTFEAAETGFVLEREGLNAPNGDHSLLAYQQALRGLRELEEQAAGQVLHSHRVRRILVDEGMRGNFLGLDDITGLLHCTSRTLARRLADEGTSFREIQAEARIELAKQLLLKPGAVIKAVYERAGFNDASSFTRAFRRYTKFTPSEFLDRHRRKG
jgi:AraC-like DNA-binding protein